MQFMFRELVDLVHGDSVLLSIRLLIISGDPLSRLVCTTTQRKT
jgi:hypothetical protein